MRLCRLYGYDALTLDFGAPSAWTHVVTARQAESGRSGRLVHSRSYLRRDIRASRRYAVRLPRSAAGIARPARRRRCSWRKARAGHAITSSLPATPSRCATTLRSDGSFELFVGRLPDGALKILEGVIRSIASERSVGPSVARFLTREGHPAKAIYLFLYPIRISGGWAFDREQHQVPQEVRPRYMMKRARKILGLSGETG